ncbi:MAG: hypothetical protein AAFV29_06910, partial [Myxococcota bacterium]
RLRFQLKTYDVLFELTDRCVAVSSKYGFPIWQALATMIRGQAMVATGDVDAGIALVDKTLGAYQARGAGLSLPYYLGLYADALERHHRLDESKGAMRQALDAAHRQGAHTERAELLRIQAILSWRRGEFEAAERGLKAALELAEAQGARSFALAAATSLSTYLTEKGRADEGRHILEPVYASFSEGFETPALQAASALL